MSLYPKLCAVEWFKKNSCPTINGAHPGLVEDDDEESPLLEQVFLIYTRYNLLQKQATESSNLVSDLESTLTEINELNERLCLEGVVAEPELELGQVANVIYTSPRKWNAAAKSYFFGEATIG